MFMFINNFPEKSLVGTKYCYYNIYINIGSAWEIHLQWQYSILSSPSSEIQSKNHSVSDKTWEAEKSPIESIQGAMKVWLITTTPF
jgi:hypothetical protein